MQHATSLLALDRHIRLQTVEGLLVQALAILDEQTATAAESLAAAKVDHALHHLRGTQINGSISSHSAANSGIIPPNC